MSKYTFLKNENTVTKQWKSKKELTKHIKQLQNEHKNLQEKYECYTPNVNIEVETLILEKMEKLKSEIFDLKEELSVLGSITSLNSSKARCFETETFSEVLSCITKTKFQDIEVKPKCVLNTI